MIDANTMGIFTQLTISMILGVALGIERTIAHKTAGMRTYALISMGSALFVILSEAIMKQYAGLPAITPLFMPAQIIVGIGFIGGGLIFVHGNTVKGLTTAASLWVTAGVGMAIGFNLYAIATFVTVMTLFIFKILWVVEDRIRHYEGINDECMIDHEGKVTCKAE